MDNGEKWIPYTEAVKNTEQHKHEVICSVYGVIRLRYIAVCQRVCRIRSFITVVRNMIFCFLISMKKCAYKKHSISLLITHIHIHQA